MGWDLLFYLVRRILRAGSQVCLWFLVRVFERVLDSYTSNDVEAGSSNENFRRVWCCVTGLAMYIVRVPGAPMICMTVSETREKRENIYTGRSHVEALECGRPTQLYAS